MVCLNQTNFNYLLLDVLKRNQNIDVYKSDRRIISINFADKFVNYKGI